MGRQPHDRQRGSWQQFGGQGLAEGARRLSREARRRRHRSRSQRQRGVLDGAVDRGQAAWRSAGCLRKRCSRGRRRRRQRRAAGPRGRCPERWQSRRNPVAQRAPVLQASDSAYLPKRRRYRARLDRRRDRPRRLRRLLQGALRNERRGSHRRGDRLERPGPRGRRVPGRHQVGKRTQGTRDAQIRGLQQPRGRTECVQGPPPARVRSTPHPRRHPDRLRRLRRRAWLQLHRRRVPAGDPPLPQGGGRRRAHRPHRQERPRHRQECRLPCPNRWRRVHLRRSLRPHVLGDGCSWAASNQAASIGRGRALEAAHRRQQHRDPRQHP